MTTTRLFQSTDASAPVLTGQVGSLIALLQACLVGTAGVAYGSGGTAKTAAGWTNPYDDATNHKSAFRNSLAAGGTGCYLHIDDNATGTAGAKEGFQIAYATMSDVNTGTHPTPTTAQLALGTIIRKSWAASSAARAWIIVADELTYYMWIESDSTNEKENSVYGGGDYLADEAANSYRFFSLGRNTQNVATGCCGTFEMTISGLAAPTLDQLGLWLGSGYALTGASVAAAFAYFSWLAGGYAIGGSMSLLSDPSPGAGKRYYIPAIVICESTIRGRLRGVYLPLNNVSSVARGTVDSNAVGLPTGSALIIMKASAYLGGGTSYAGRCGVESALAW